MVKSAKVVVAPSSTVIALNSESGPPPCTASTDAPGPVIVMSALSSSVAASGIVPDRPDWKRIVLPGSALASATA